MCNGKLRRLFCKVRFLLNDSEPFETKSGLQWDSLSSLLFSLVLDKIVRSMNKQRKMGISGESITPMIL